MTTKEFAALLQAKRTNRGWSAKCPAHDDRSPSLSIREGDGGRVLLRCFAGCSVDSILADLKLGRRDLFAGPPPNPEQLAALRAAKVAREQAEHAKRQTRLAAIVKAEKLQAVVNALGAKLACHPEDDVLASAFHQACNLQHRAQAIADALSQPPRREKAQDRKAS
jgi:hypothetical protein